MTRLTDLFRRFDRNLWILFALALGWFLTLGVRFLLPALLPQIKLAFDVDNTVAGLAITVVWLGYGLMQFPAGMLLDRLNERTMLTMSLALAGLCLGIIATAPVFAIFFLGCALFGFVTGLYGTTRGITLSRVFTSNPGRAFGVTLGAGSIGSATLPVIGSQVTQAFDWRVAILLSVPLFALTAVVMWRSVPTTDQSSSSETADISMRDQLGMLRQGFRKRSVVVGAVGYTLMLFTYQALTGFLPTYLIQEKMLTATTASTLFAVLFLGGAVSQITVGSAADRFGTRPVMLVIAFVGILTLAVLPLVENVFLLTGLIVVMSSRIASPSILNPYIINGLPDEAEGTSWGLLRTVFFSIGATGSTVVGFLSDIGFFDEAFYLLAGLTAVATLFFVFLPEAGRRRTA